MFRHAKVVWRSSEDIRGLLIRYYTERKTIPDAPTGTLEDRKVRGENIWPQPILYFFMPNSACNWRKAASS